MAVVRGRIAVIIRAMDVSVGQFIAICLGGGLGSVVRAGLAGWMGRHIAGWNAVFVINLTGSFLIGVAWAAAAGDTGVSSLSQTAYLLFAVGFLGGYTTVSTHALQVWEMWEQGAPRPAALVAAISLTTCPLAALLGASVASAWGLS